MPAPRTRRWRDPSEAAGLVQGTELAALPLRLAKPGIEIPC